MPNKPSNENETFQSPTAQLLGMDLGPWPELDELALILADDFNRSIAKATLADNHKVPYKNLMLKGKVIQILRSRL